MYVEFDYSYWSKYREDTSNPSMNHLTYCKGMIDALKSLNIWSSVEEDLPIKSQFYDVEGYLCDREFVCGLTEEEWDYVGNLLVTLPNYPTPLFFFCAYPILSPRQRSGEAQANTSRRYITNNPLVFVSFGLNDFESYASSEQHFTVSDGDVISDYDISTSTAYNNGDLVRFDGNVYRCIYDGCTHKPWANRNQWLPQFEYFTSREKSGKKVYTAGMLLPKYLASFKESESPDAYFSTYFYNKTKTVTNWYVGKNDVVYQWRVEDVPYAKGTIVEYNGKRYKNVSDNVYGCSCIPMPYNFVPPYGCSGHWLPEFFEDLPIEAQSPILPVFSGEGRIIKGNKPAEDFIISYLHDTLTFVDCVGIGITERGWKDAHLCVDEYFPGKGDAWVSISPGPTNNLQTDVLCDYYVFGGTWALGSDRIHFTISRDDKYCEVAERANYVGPQCPKSTIIFNEIWYADSVTLNDSTPTAQFSDLYVCGLINAYVDSKDGSAQVKLNSDNGINLSSDYPMRLSFTTTLYPVDLTSKEVYYKDSNYTKYSMNMTPRISTASNYCVPSVNRKSGLVDYIPLYIPDSSKGGQALVHEQSALRSQLNSINYLAPIWMYVRREPVVLDNWSTVFKSSVLFACDAVYNDYKSRLFVDGKTYIIFKYLVGTYSTNNDRCGVAILVDEGEY